jgi:TonB family protein
MTEEVRYSIIWVTLKRVVLNLFCCFRILYFCSLDSLPHPRTGVELPSLSTRKIRERRHPESPQHDRLTADSLAGIKEEMILTPASGVQKPERYDLYVGKLRAICEMHGIGTGSPDDLCSFPQRLEEDRRFSMDFWGLVGKLSRREGGELSDEQMLTVVIAAVTGRETLEENDTRLRYSLDELRALLSGVDLHGTESPTTQRAIAAMQHDHVRPKRFSLTPSLVHQESANPPIPPSNALQTQLEQTVQRLELVNRQLSQSLAYLDERFRRLEAQFELSSPLPAQSELPDPPFEPSAPVNEQSPPLNDQVASSLDQPDLHHAAPSQGDPGDLLPKNPAKPRLVLDPVALPAETPPAPKLAKAHSGPLFEGYASESGHSKKKAAIGLAIILLLAGSGFAWLHYGTQIREMGTHLVQRIHPTESQPAPAQNPDQSSDAVPAESASPIAQPAVEQTGTEATTLSTTQPVEPPHKAVPERATTNAPQDALASSNFSGVKVAGALMEKNLIVSRVPAYPEIARASRVQGSVIVQALITKTGAVSRVHVLQGDSRLRTAAIAAIYGQRYRPYLVNGIPVDVITTITMNFTPGQ